MISQSAIHNLSKFGEGKTNVKVNGNRKEQGLRMWVRKRMLCLTIILMGHNMEGNIIKVMLQDSCSVGHVIRSILRGIVCKLRVVGLIFTVHMKHRQLGMLGRASHGFMYHWIKSS